MNKKKYYIIILPILLLALTQCLTPSESERVIKKKSIAYLEKKYNKKFKINRFQQFFHGGHWEYTTELFISPKDNEEIEFILKYSEKNKKVLRDNYKHKLWSYELEQEIKNILEPYYYSLKVNVVFNISADSYLSCSKLPYYATYNEMITKIPMPAVDIELHIAKHSSTREDILDGILALSNKMGEKSFTRITFEIYFVKNSCFKEAKKLHGKMKFDELDVLFYHQLLFNYTHEDPLPSKNDISELLQDYRENALYYKNDSLMNKADTLMKCNQEEKAIIIYNEIINNVSKYRFRHHVPSQTVFSIDAANVLAQYYESNEDTTTANKYYQFIVDKLKYRKALLDNFEEYKLALEKLGYDKDYPHSK